MQRWVASDADSPSLLLQLLHWREMAMVYSTCRAWKSYICTTGHVLTTSNHSWYHLTGSESKSIPSQWVCTRVHRLLLDCENSSETCEELVAAIAVVPTFPKLESIQITTRLSHSVTSTVIEILGTLPLLRDISIQTLGGGNWAESLRAVSLSPLRRLPHLTSFFLDGVFYPTKKQVDDIVCCSKLERLRCGLWFERHSKLESRDRATWIEQGVGRLHELTNLKEIIIDDEVMEEDAWIHLAKCSSITSLQHGHHLHTRDWSLLAQFRELRVFFFRACTANGYGERVPPPKAMWKSFQACNKIEQLTLEYVKLDTQLLTEMLTTLSQLTNLQLRFSSLESLVPFKEATALTRTVLREVLDFNNQAIPWGDDLPIMPNLIECDIADSWFARIVIDNPICNLSKEELIRRYRVALSRKMPRAQFHNIMYTYV